MAVLKGSIKSDRHNTKLSTKKISVSVSRDDTEQTQGIHGSIDTNHINTKITSTHLSADLNKGVPVPVEPQIDNVTLVKDAANVLELNPILNGNYLIVETLNDRNNIPKGLLKCGTLVKVNRTKILYEWDGINWTKSSVNILGLGTGLKLSPDGVLSVDTTDKVEKENPKPVTSNGVYNVVGVINERLDDI